MENTVGYKRQVVKARDIMYFFGKQERQSFKMMAEMKKHFNKKNHQPITVNNFCDYYDIAPDEFNSALQATDIHLKLDAEKRKDKIISDANSIKEQGFIPYKFSPKMG